MPGIIKIEIRYWEANFTDADFKQDYVLMRHVKQMLPNIIFAEDMPGCRRAEHGTIHIETAIRIEPDEIIYVDKR